MADKTPPKDEFTDDHFEEEFNFEGQEPGNETKFPSLSKRAAPQKYLITGISIAVLGFIGYFGYRFFAAEPTQSVIARSTTTQPSKAPVKTDQATGKPAPATATTTLASTTPTTSATSPKASTPTTAPTAPATPPASTTPAATALVGKSQPTAITEQDIQSLLNPPGSVQGTIQPAQSEKPTESAQPAQPVQAEKQPEGAQTEKPKEVTTAAQAIPAPAAPIPAATTTSAGTSSETLSKAVEPKATEGAPQTTGVIPKLENLPLGEAAGQASAVNPPLPGVNPPTSATELQEFQQQTQKTLEAFTKLNQQMENNLNQIKYLDSYTREVSLTVEKLNAQVTTMDNRIQALTHLANSLSKDLSKVRNEVGYVKRVVGDEGLDIPPAPTASRQRNLEYAYPNAIEDGIDCMSGSAVARKKGGQGARNEDLEYVVHAVIPGRAWLKSAKGQIMTVTEGENIGNYGKILVIDAANGVVLTSSGVAFR